MSNTQLSPTTASYSPASLPLRGVRSVASQQPASLLPKASASAWKTLLQWLPTRDENLDFWWQTTGYHVSVLLAASEYSLQQQYECLLFHYRFVVPSLGLKPISTVPRWKSFMTDDYSPVEYSWKWGMGHDQRPEIRYGIEAIGKYAGTAVDMLNQHATLELLHNLKATMPSLNLTWFYHFAKTFYGQSTAGAENNQSSSMFLAIEFVGGEMRVKAYFIPTPSKNNSVLAQIVKAVRDTGYSDMRAMEKMQAYLENDGHGSTLQPFMVGIDCVAPAESRIKVYVRSPGTSFDCVRSVMTLDGLRKGLEQPLEQFRDLWNLTLGLDADYPTSKELRTARHATSGTCFYFDIAPGASTPDVKAYIPVRHYSQSDAQVARSLGAFLEKHGRATYMDGYKRSLSSLATSEGLDGSCGVQTYISCAIQKGQVAMTSYLSPQMHHTTRWTEALAQREGRGRVGRSSDW